MSLPPEADRKKLIALLYDLSRAVEDLLFSGLTTASDTTRQTLELSFRSASQMRLLRLGATLRVATEELGRYARQDDTFSRKRFSFFLHRAWMLSQGMQQALTYADEGQWNRLIGQTASEAVDVLEVVTLGVSKRVVPNAFCAFEFRLRTVGGTTSLAPGNPVVWSCVFPLKPGAKITAETFLHLQQKQKFKGTDFLEKKVVRIEAARLGHEAALSRLSLTDSSQVTLRDSFDDWTQFGTWDVDRAIDRVTAHDTTPFDLEIELQEEIVLTDWQAGDEIERPREPLFDIPIKTPGAALYATVSRDAEHQVLRDALSKRRRKRQAPPPLYGILHYERCCLMLQPLSFLHPDGPELLTISDKRTSAAELLRSMKF